MGVPPEVTGREEATVEVVGLSIIGALQAATKMGQDRRLRVPPTTDTKPR